MPVEASTVAVLRGCKTRFGEMKPTGNDILTVSICSEGAFGDNSLFPFQKGFQDRDLFFRLRVFGSTFFLNTGIFECRRLS